MHFDFRVLFLQHSPADRCGKVIFRRPGPHFGLHKTVGPVCLTVTSTLPGPGWSHVFVALATVTCQPPGASHGEPRSLGTSTWQVQVARLNTVTQATRLRLVAYFAYFKFAYSSGIVTSGTRTGFLVCTWFVPVHTGMYRYVLLYTKFQSTYRYVLSTYQNKVLHVRHK